MPSKSFFPKFWQSQATQDSKEHATITEAPMHDSKSPAAETGSSAHSELLCYEDIYNAAGIAIPASGYGIRKVVDMLESERIRELPEDVKRASVLMALDAAGASVDDLMKDATRKQSALDSYEQGQRTQLDDFEAMKSQENIQIEAELERIRVHYAERIQKNRDQVEREKEALRNWQMSKQSESRRISEVIELCSNKKAAPGNPSKPADEAKPGEKPPGKAASEQSLAASAGR